MNPNVSSMQSGGSIPQSDPGARSFMDANSPNRYAPPMSAGGQDFSGNPQDRILRRAFGVQRNQYAPPLPYSTSTKLSSTYGA